MFPLCCRLTSSVRHVGGSCTMQKNRLLRVGGLQLLPADPIGPLIDCVGKFIQSPRRVILILLLSLNILLRHVSRWMKIEQKKQVKRSLTPCGSNATSSIIFDCIT